MLLDAAFQDLRYGLRRLLRDPWTTASLTLIMALGIGPNALVFSLLRATLLRPLPYAAPDRLVVVWNATGRSQRSGVSAAQVEQWSRQPELFASTGAFKAHPGQVLTGAGEAARLQVVAATASLFQTLGAHAALGRTFLPADSSEDEVILSFRLWQRQFRGDPEVSGKRVSLGDRHYSVVGVMPDGFEFPQELFPRWTSTDAWVPLRLTPVQLADTSRTLTVVGRLEKGVRVETAAHRLSLLLSETPQTKVISVNVLSLQEAVMGEIRPGLLLLVGVVAFVLLLACANITNLLLAGMEARRRDMAIRLALGATSFQIARQVLTQVALLGLGGAGLGLVLAACGLRVSATVLPPEFPRFGHPQVDLVVILTSAMIAVAAMALSSLAPILAARGTPVSSTLAASDMTALPAPRRARIRDYLVTGEIALAVILTSASVLSLRSFRKVVDVEPGFDARPVLTASISLPYNRYSEDQRMTLFVGPLLEQLESAPGISAAAAATGIPGLQAGTASPFTAPSSPDAPFRSGPTANIDAVTGNYFRALSIPLLAGRSFGSWDRADSEHVAIVDTAAARLLGSGPAVDKQIALADMKMTCRVVGVVGRMHLFGAPNEAAPHIYLPMSQAPLPSFVLVLRTTENAKDVATTLRRALRGIDPQLPAGTVVPLAQRIADQTGDSRFRLIMTGTFGVLALLLAAFGVFSVTRYSVSLRRREVAIRSSLGASPAQLVNLILGSGLSLLVRGLVFGVVGAVVFLDLFSATLPGVKAVDPAAIGSAVLLVSFAAVSAILIPAREVVQVEAVRMLRSQ